MLGTNTEEPSLAAGDRHEDHYDAVESEALALAPDRVRKVNLEVPWAVAMALALLPRLRRLRESLASTLGDFDLRRFDRLEDYTRALSVVHARHVTATTPSDGLRELHVEGIALRERLRADLVPLIARGLLAPGCLDRLTWLVGFKNVGNELQVIAFLLKDHWEALQGRCATTEAELERAWVISERLLRGAGERASHRQAVPARADLRDRVFTLFIEAYEEARAAIRYLRRAEGDAETFAPSLYTNRGRAKSRRKAEDAPASPAVPPPDSPAGDAPQARRDGDTVTAAPRASETAMGPAPRWAFAKAERPEADDEGAALGHLGVGLRWGGGGWGSRSAARALGSPAQNDESPAESARLWGVGHERLELSANGLRVRCSTN